MTATTRHGVQERLASAREFAARAGAATLRHFQRDDLRIEMKRDGTPVTNADREAEQLLRTWVRERFAEDGLIGEEFGVEEGRGDYRWVFDPIDGTKSFACGVPLYGTLVGVEHRAQDGAWTSVIGVVEMPALRERVWGARGLGAWHQRESEQERPARVSGVGSLGESVFVTTGREYFEKGRALRVHEHLASVCRLTRGWGDCYGLVLVATGRAEVWCEPLVHVWDVAPALPIMLEAGGAYSDWSGAPDIRASTCLATNGRVHAEALAAIGEACGR